MLLFGVFGHGTGFWTWAFLLDVDHLDLDVDHMDDTDFWTWISLVQNVGPWIGRGHRLMIASGHNANALSLRACILQVWCRRFQDAGAAGRCYLCLVYARRTCGYDVGREQARETGANLQEVHSRATTSRTPKDPSKNTLKAFAS